MKKEISTSNIIIGITFIGLGVIAIWTILPKLIVFIAGVMLVIAGFAFLSRD